MLSLCSGAEGRVFDKRKKNPHKAVREKEVTINKLCSQGKGKILALLKSLGCLPESCRQRVLSRTFN